MRSLIARVIFGLTLTTINLTQAGWFDNGAAEDDIRKRRERGRQEDTVEGRPSDYQEQYEEDYGSRGRGGDKNASEARRERLREMRKEKRPRDRDEMMSGDYNQKIMRDQEVEETHTPDEDDYLSDEDINRIWSEHMHDFVPEDMSNVVVEKRSTEALFEWISHEEPSTIKGAYYVLGGNPEKTVSCIVYDPNREVLYKRKGSAQGILLFNTTMPGEYAIIFSNMQAQEDLTVTLALHTYEDKEEQVKYDILADGTRVQIEGFGAEAS